MLLPQVAFLRPENPRMCFAGAPVSVVAASGRPSVLRDRDFGTADGKLEPCRAIDPLGGRAEMAGHRHAVDGAVRLPFFSGEKGKLLRVPFTWPFRRRGDHQILAVSDQTGDTLTPLVAHCIPSVFHVVGMRNLV